MKHYNGMTEQAREAIGLRILNTDETGVQLTPGTYIRDIEIKSQYNIIYVSSRKVWCPKGMNNVLGVQGVRKTITVPEMESFYPLIFFTRSGGPQHGWSKLADYLTVNSRFLRKHLFFTELNSPRFVTRAQKFSKQRRNGLDQLLRYHFIYFCILIF